jgi:hypothetical protein
MESTFAPSPSHFVGPSLSRTRERGRRHRSSSLSRMRERAGVRVFAVEENI